MSIPKLIHYCWFGGKPLTKLAKKCIQSWKKFFPDYEIKEWNECNFNINIIPYTSESYRQKKYAFVSDFARYWILYNYGGIYFDTDVEVIKSFEDILEKGPFLGIEKDRDKISVAPGLGMGAIPGMAFYKKVVDFYSNIKPDIKLEPYLVSKTTEMLSDIGFIMKDEIQEVSEILIYPNEYFNPLCDYDGRLTITMNTHSIHFYAKSWVHNYGPIRNFLTRKFHKFFFR